MTPIWLIAINIYEVLFVKILFFFTIICEFEMFPLIKI